jgi:hypothetical protein
VGEDLRHLSKSYPVSGVRVSAAEGDKYWVADTLLVKLQEAGNLSLIFMNLGSVNFENLYANWSDDEKKNSRVSRAVWLAMQGFDKTIRNGEKWFRRRLGA